MIDGQKHAEGWRPDLRRWWRPDPQRGAQTEQPVPVPPATTDAPHPWDPEGDVYAPDDHGARMYVPLYQRVPRQPAPRQQQMESPADGVQTYTDAGGQDFLRELSFQAHSVLIDNLTPQWLYFPSAQRWVPPNAFGVVIPLAQATQSASYKFLSPPNYVQPAFVAGTYVTTTWYASMFGPSMGTLLKAVP